MPSIQIYKYTSIQSYSICLKGRIVGIRSLFCHDLQVEENRSDSSRDSSDVPSSGKRKRDSKETVKDTGESSLHKQLGNFFPEVCRPPVHHVH